MNVNQHYKGVSGLLTTFRENQQKHLELKALLDRINERIQNEEQEDGKFVANNPGVAAGIKRSLELNAVFKQNLGKYRSYLSDAGKTVKRKKKRKKNILLILVID